MTWLKNKGNTFTLRFDRCTDFETGETYSIFPTELQLDADLCARNYYSEFDFSLVQAFNSSERHPLAPFDRHNTFPAIECAFVQLLSSFYIIAATIALIYEFMQSVKICLSGLFDTTGTVTIIFRLDRDISFYHKYFRSLEPRECNTIVNNNSLSLSRDSIHSVAVEGNISLISEHLEKSYEPPPPLATFISEEDKRLLQLAFERPLPEPSEYNVDEYYGSSIGISCEVQAAYKYLVTLCAQQATDTPTKTPGVSLNQLLLWEPVVTALEEKLIDRQSVIDSFALADGLSQTSNEDWSTDLSDTHCLSIEEFTLVTDLIQKRIDAAISTDKSASEPVCGA